MLCLPLFEKGDKRRRWSSTIKELVTLLSFKTSAIQTDVQLVHLDEMPLVVGIPQGIPLSQAFQQHCGHGFVLPELFLAATECPLSWPTRLEKASRNEGRVQNLVVYFVSEGASIQSCLLVFVSYSVQLPYFPGQVQVPSKWNARCSHTHFWQYNFTI